MGRVAVVAGKICNVDGGHNVCNPPMWPYPSLELIAGGILVPQNTLAGIRPASLTVFMQSNSRNAIVRRRANPDA